MLASGSRRGALDGIRGTAALIVLGSHTLIAAVYGALGVWLFFVLSGYLLAANAIKKNYLTGYGLANYLLRRVLRIYPLYAVLVTYNVVIGYGMPHEYFNFHWCVKSITLAWADGYFWTVKEELIFYLILPFILIACAPFRRWPLVAVGLLTVMAICASLFLTVDVLAIKISDTGRADLRIAPFLAGIAIALLGQVKIPKYLPSVAGDVTLVLICLSIFYIFHFFGSRLGSLQSIESYGLLAAAIFLVDTNRAPWGAKLLSFKPLQLIGIIGYGFYLWHWPVICGLHKAGLVSSPWATFVCTILITIPIATLTYWLIERPSQRLALPQFNRQKEVGIIATKKA